MVLKVSLLFSLRTCGSTGTRMSLLHSVAVKALDCVLHLSQWDHSGTPSEYGVTCTYCDVTLTCNGHRFPSKIARLSVPHKAGRVR
jgi:hypothetical protein